MSSRIIRSQGGSKILLDCISSILSVEAVLTSKEIFIISPWISNSPLIDNSTGKYSSVFPLVESNTIYLVDILTTFNWRGSRVKIICDPNAHGTKSFIEAMKDKAEFRMVKYNHEKGMVTDNFYLHGSMNFTYSGVHINSENIRVTNDKPEISSALISIRTRWEEAEEI